MDESSAKTLNNEYKYFIERSNLDKKNYKYQKALTKTRLLEIRKITLMDMLSHESYFDHLLYTANYADKLLNENLNNYRKMYIYSKTCVLKNKYDDFDYQEFSKYCCDFSKIADDLYNALSNKTCNSSLIFSLVDIDEKQEQLNEKNKELNVRVNSFINNNDLKLEKSLKSKI